mmetsp:Transcript_5750/g.14785  ORF Transcript_5750/g.14785 Transcript_5750/m.14785 type:complete len:207 (-) Transcript_5750:78-698(-)
MEDTSATMAPPSPGAGAAGGAGGSPAAAGSSPEVVRSPGLKGGAAGGSPGAPAAPEVEAEKKEEVQVAREDVDLLGLEQAQGTPNSEKAVPAQQSPQELSPGSARKKIEQYRDSFVSPVVSPVVANDPASPVDKAKQQLKGDTGQGDNAQSPFADKLDAFRDLSGEKEESPSSEVHDKAELFEKQIPKGPKKPAASILERMKMFES